MIKNLMKIFLWILAFVPLVVDESVFYPETSGKNLLIETCLVLVGILLLINFFYLKSFREEIIDKVIRFIKNPLVISIFAFISIFVISTIFAGDKYSALWGNLSRAEGLAGTIFFFSFFVFSLLTFEKKDWLWFFKYSLFVSLILLVKEFSGFYQGVDRSGSYAGNPTFLAGYLLFSISSSFIIFNEVKSNFLKYFSTLIILLSIAGIFIAQTRGTILGLGLGFIVVLVYCIVRGKDINYKIFNLRKVSVVLLCLVIIFSGVFVITRKNEIWQGVPGISRLATTSIDSYGDSTISRLYIYKASFHSLNPIENGFGRFLVGWGPDNYIIANSKYYDARQYKYETNWYDRAHNKFIDILVMNGILGFLAYLAIWFFLFKSFLKRKIFSILDAGLLFFSVSFLVHLLFVFDQISTSIAFFTILAFTTYLTFEAPAEGHEKAIISTEMKERREILVGSFLVILTIFLGFVYLKNTLPGYWQMRSYTSLIQNPDLVLLESEVDSVFRPFTVSQMNIRRDFLKFTNDLYSKMPGEVTDQLLKKSITQAEDYISKRSGDFIFMTTIADVYSRKGNSLKNSAYLERGEELLRQILSFAPNRPDVNFGLAINLFYQKKYSDSFVYFEKGFGLYTDYFKNDPKKVEGYYGSFAKYFYEQKNKVDFIKVIDRLKVNDYRGSATLDKVLEYLNKTGTWPKVSFN